MTEDEEEIKTKPDNFREIWEIKRDIKVSFKRDVKAPDTLMKYYKIGRKIGRGSFGKVNLALHKLTRKVVAVKSINKKKEKVEGDEEKISILNMERV
jgi:serine/threonine protein kinase